MLIRNRKKTAVMLLALTALLCGCGSRSKVPVTDEGMLQRSGYAKDAYVTIQEEAVPLAAVPRVEGAEAAPTMAEQDPLQTDLAEEAQIQQPVPTQEVEMFLREGDALVEVTVETEELEVVQETAQQDEVKRENIPEETVKKDAEAKEPVKEEAIDASAFSAGVQQAVNDAREAAGLPGLSTTPELSAAASLRAAEIAGSFSHTRPGGADYSTAVTEAGGNFGNIGENLFYGMQSVTAIQNAWSGSEIHLENIMNGSFTHIGIGVAETPDGLYVVQLFTD